MMSTIRGPLRAGAAKVDITPQELAGLTNLWKHPFEGVHDQIFLRALVVDNGTNTAAIVAADLLEFGDTRLVRERIEIPPRPVPAGEKRGACPTAKCGRHAHGVPTSRLRPGWSGSPGLGPDWGFGNPQSRY